MNSIQIAVAACLMASSAAAQEPLNFSGLPGRTVRSGKVTEQVRFYCNWMEAGRAQEQLALSQAEEEPDAQYCYGFTDIDETEGDEIIRVNVNFFACNPDGCPFEIFTLNRGRWHAALIQGPQFARIPPPRTFATTMTAEHGTASSVLIANGQRFRFSRVTNTGPSAFEKGR